MNTDFRTRMIDEIHTEVGSELASTGLIYMGPQYEMPVAPKPVKGGPSLEVSKQIRELILKWQALSFQPTCVGNPVPGG